MSRKSQRSRVEMFRKDFITLARECGGSYATKADRVRIAKYFLNYLRENGIKLRDTHSINTRHFQGYLLSRKAQGISHRTIQNERAVMRAILQKDGRYKLAAPDNPLLSNETLGLTNTCRDGKKYRCHRRNSGRHLRRWKKRIPVLQRQCNFLMYWVCERRKQSSHVNQLSRGCGLWNRGTILC